MYLFILFLCITCVTCLGTAFFIRKSTFLKNRIFKKEEHAIKENHHNTVIKVDYRKLLDKYMESQCELANVCEIDLHSDSEITNQFIDSCTKHVIQNISDPKYSVLRLSQDMNMERTGLYKKLNKATQCTPKMFIKNIRMNYAMGLVKQGKYSKEDIAKMCGFESVVKLLLEYPGIIDQNTDN